MSYQAIARKWRPTTFDEIAGQTHVTRTLRNAIRLGRIHHAFLFTGARGVGKTSAARALARSLNCEQGPTTEPCGVCASCRDILTGASSDVIEIDGASNNSVEDVRDLRESVRYLPARGKYKIYIVDEVHMLSKGAFNALLKTLEEPPPHVVFVFATTEPQKIPDTILSRVQRFDFKRIPMQIVIGRLAEVCQAEGVQIPEAGLRLIARAGEGSMRDSQSLLDQVISFAGNAPTTDQVADVLGLVDRGLLYQMLEGILKGEADPCLEAVESVYTYGYDLSEFTSELLELLRNAALVGLSPRSQRWLDVADEERERLVALSSGVPTDVFVRAFQVILDVHEQVARAVQPRLVLEMAVARLVAIRPARPVDHLLERIADLERRVRHGGGTLPPRGGGDGSGGAAPAGGGRGSPVGGGGGGFRASEAGSPGPAQASASPPSPASPSSPPRPTAPSPPPRSPSAPPARPAPNVARDAAPRGRPVRDPMADAPPLPPPPDDAPDLGDDDDDGALGAYEDYGQPSASRPSAPRPVPTSAVPDPAARPAPAPAPRPTPPSPRASAAPAAPLAKPPAPAPDASAADRFALLQVWLEEQSGVYEQWARDAVISVHRPPVLELAFADDRTLRLAGKSRDEVVNGALRVFFPECLTVSVGLRATGGQKTAREQATEELAAHLAALRAEMEVHPVVCQVRDRLGALLEDVKPDREASP